MILPLLLSMASALPAYGQTATASATTEPSKTDAPSPPPYKQLRYDEDWSSLHDPKLRTDALDRIKYIPLNKNDDWYLSIGGEIRERYELLNHPLWGQDPEDNNGYFMQRYMLHADLHLGTRVR